MRVALSLIATLSPTAAFAQAAQCDIPRVLPRPRPDLPSASQPKRIEPIGGYTLALIWQPRHCVQGVPGASDMRCDGASAKRGFTLHGLWPDGEGDSWPQYCRATDILPPATLRAHYCATPSAQLLQHEWAKHGTCVAPTPAAYFGKSAALYRALRFPDMRAIARRGPITAGALAGLIAKANRGMRADMLRITASRDNWLQEVWVCLDKSLRYARCRAGSGGLPMRAKIKVTPPL